jgi:hypothetical protein
VDLKRELNLFKEGWKHQKAFEEHVKEKNVLINEVVLDHSENGGPQNHGRP